MIFMALAHETAGWPTTPIVVSGANPSVTAAIHRLAVDRHVVLCGTLAEGVTRVDGRALPSRLSASYPPDPGTVALVRRTVVDACLAWELATAADVAELVATELVSNAVRHARTRIDVSLTRADRRLHIAIRDYSPAPARIVDPDPDPDPGPDGWAGGRGLRIVEAVSARWGCRPLRDGKVIWATL